MGKFKYDLTVSAVNAFGAACITVLFGLCWFSFYEDALFAPFHLEGWCVTALFCLVYRLLCRAYNSFEVVLQSVQEAVYSQALSILFADVIFYFVTCLLARRFVNVLPILGTFAVQLLAAALWCAMKRRWHFTSRPAVPSVVVYSDHTEVDELIAHSGLDKSFNVTSTVDADSCLADLSMLDSAGVVFLSDVSSSQRNEILKYCVERDIDVYVTPRIGDTLMQSARQVHLFHLPVLQVGRYHPAPLYLFLKRSFDILASALALLVLSPLFLVTSVAIKAYDGGPVFYTQDRLTRNGKIFKIHKFRSMRVDAEKDGVARLSTGEHDDRITPVGRVIRKTRIDELPQLVDILKGDLSVVGPRPERPEIAAQYEETMPEFRLRLQAKAGLTGYAQVYGKYNTRPYDKLKMDLMYISRPSVIEDLRICFATVKILFMPESTEGIAEGATTALGVAQDEETAVESREMLRM